MRIDDNQRPTRIAVSILLGSAALVARNGDDSYGGAADPPPPSTILAPWSNAELAGTVAPNGDLNPYFITTPPPSFTGVNGAGVKTVLQPGDLPLNAPIGLTLNPLNGDLITVNQLDNNMVEIDPNLTGSAGTQSPGVGTVMAVLSVDSTPVDAEAGTGSALFGVLATKDAEGNLTVYYTDSNTNSLNALK